MSKLHILVASYNIMRLSLGGRGGHGTDVICIWIRFASVLLHLWLAETDHPYSHSQVRHIQYACWR